MSENFIYGNGTNRLYGVSDAIDSDSSLTVASSKAIKLINDKVTNIETDITSIESTATTALAVANNALPKSGGKITGSIQEHVIGLEGTSITLDLTVCNNFVVDITGATTFTVVAKNDYGLQLGTLILNNGGAYTVTWPSNFKWDNGTPPSLMVGGTDIITFFSVDNVPTWYYAAQVMTGIVWG